MLGMTGSCRAAGTVARLARTAVGVVAGVALALPAAWADGVAGERAQARALFAELVAVDSSPGSGRVPQLTGLLAARFLAGGFDARDVTVVPFKDTASLVVRYRGDGSGGRPIALLAHLDVVAARAEDWGRNPYSLVEEHGYFIGRGTLDVKQEVALMATSFLAMRAQGFVPTRDLVLVFTGDEETDGETAEDLVLHHRDLVDAEFALNSDNLGGGVLDEVDGHPRLFRVQGAEKASVNYYLEAHGTGGHSSQPRADNAIYALANALAAIQRYRFPVMWNDWTRGDFRETGAITPGALGDAMRAFARNPRDRHAADVLSADSVFVGRVRTTCVATMIEGGHAPNALPQSAKATVSCRIFPGMSATQVYGTLRRLAGPAVTVHAGPDVIVADASPLRADVMAAVRRAVAAANPGARIAPTQSSYATDGAVFRSAGIPTYGVGGTFIRESEQFAHGVNERIPVESFYRGLVHWQTLVRALAGR